MSKINYDGLVNAQPQQVAHATMVLLHELQNHQPPVQAAALAATFVLLCEHYGVEPQDVMTATKNLLLAEGQGKRPEFGAARDYLRYEVRR